jgi:hypothetical protein
VIETVRASIDNDALFERSGRVSTPEASEACLAEITRALESVKTLSERARLLLWRARVRSNQGLDHGASEDAAAAMALFQMAGDTELAIGAANLGAAHAARFGWRLR